VELPERLEVQVYQVINIDSPIHLE
jgi:hypothetical protein